jgi:hypothetical protein
MQHILMAEEKKMSAQGVQRWTLVARHSLPCLCTMGFSASFVPK